MRHNDFREWEIDFSTRQAAHPYIKYVPFRQALSTTAATIVTAGQGEIAVNIVPNPSFESSDLTMYIPVGAALAQSTSEQAASLNSMSVNPAASAAEEGFYWSTIKVPFNINGQEISAQIEHLEATNDGTSVKLEIRAVNGTTVLGTSGNVALADAWTRSTARYTVPANTATVGYRVYMTTVGTHNTTFYVDKFMFEVREDSNRISTYVDGDVGLNYEWAGVANASESRKRPDMTLIRGITITSESSTSAEIVYVGLDVTASPTTGIPILNGVKFENTWPLGFRYKVSLVAATGSPIVNGVIWGV